MNPNGRPPVPTCSPPLKILGEAQRLGISSAARPLFGLLWPSDMRLASLVCQRAGADITASDCHPMARGFMRHNLRQNGLARLPYRHGHWTDLLHGPAPHAPRSGSSTPNAATAHPFTAAWLPSVLRW